MIKIIQMLLQEKECNLKEFDDRILLFEKDLNIWPEDYIEIKKDNSVGQFLVLEVHRNAKQMKVKTKKEEEAAIFAVILYKRLYDNITNRIKARKIRNYLDSDDEKKALSYAIEQFDDSIYTVNDEENLKISLICSKNHIDVKFSGEYLVKDATLKRGYVAFYNYCEELQYISLFCAEIEKKLNISIEHENILRLYLLGHL